MSRAVSENHRSFSCRSLQVEQHHRCDLNTARGYVVYSALGSFYIPGVVMIFVYIRIFMVVYDRENLIKSFQRNQSSMNSIKAAQNGQLQKTDLSSKRSKLPKLTSCLCFRRPAEPLQPGKSPLPPCPFNHGPAIEQKQNGHLVYRFTKGTANSNGSNAHPPSPPTAVLVSKSKTSIFSRSHRSHSSKQLDHISEELYQYQHEYLVQVPADYQLRSDESPCYDFQTFDTSLSPLFKCRSRSFEQSIPSKIRDLNTELSHSRQLKAAAAVAATTTTTTMSAPSTTVDESLQHGVRCVTFVRSLRQTVPREKNARSPDGGSRCLTSSPLF